MKLALLFLLILYAPICCSNGYQYADSQSLDYFNLKVNEQHVIISFNLDEIMTVNSCANEAYTICFFSSRLSLAIPKDVTKLDRWCIANQCFNKRILESFSYGNKSHEYIYEIESPEMATFFGRVAGKKTYWYYSVKDGVVAFKYSNDERFFKLVGPKGLILSSNSETQ